MTGRSQSFFGGRGFTLIELLLSVSIFTIIIVAFVGMLVAVTGVGVQQSAATAVNQESQLLLQKIQYYVQTASYINIPTSTQTSTLQLIMATSSMSPVSITLTTSTNAPGVVYLQQTTSSPWLPLTSKRVSVTSLSFTRQSNPPGHDVVNIAFTMQYYAPNNLAESFSQLFQSSVARVSAATFDTSVLASTPNEPLGNSTNPWSPIDGVIYYSGGNVGIAQSSPQQPLDVNGGVKLNPTSASKPSCTTSTVDLGTIWFTPNGAGTSTLYICTTVSGVENWHQILTN